MWENHKGSRTESDLESASQSPNSGNKAEHVQTLPGVEVDQERTLDGEKKITLSEQIALEHARAFPEDTTPLRICFAKDDKDNPRNWSRKWKWYLSLLVGWLNFSLSMAISSLSLSFEQLSNTFGISMEVATITLSIGVVIVGPGAAILAPLSEHFGRRPVYVLSGFALFIFTLPIALAPNYATVLVCRALSLFLGGAAAPNAGGTIHDLWVRDEAGSPLTFYVIGTVTSPGFTTIVMGYVTMNLGWRWTQWLIMIITGVTWLFQLFLMPETRHTIILQKKANRLHKQLKKEGLNNTRIDDQHVDERHGFSHLMTTTLFRSCKFLVTEPIAVSLAFYQALLFGIIYLFQGSFPLVFGMNHGFNVGEQGLSFLGLTIGTLIGALITPFQNRFYVSKLHEAQRGVPEARMWSARVGGWLIPISLFWFAWTSYASVPWIVPVLASGLFGIGFFNILLAVVSYVVDAYGSYAASGLATILLVRALTGFFPLFGTQMYKTLGYEWATSLLAFLSLVVAPLPLFFFYRGEKLRLRSPFASEHFYQEEDLG